MAVPCVANPVRMEARASVLARIARVGLLLLATFAIASMASPVRVQSPRMLDGFDAPSAWKVIASDQVGGSLRAVDGVDGHALCLDYDFHGVSGYVGMQRELPLDYPQDYAFTIKLRGDAPANDLQFKLIDASGDNVWWVDRPRFDVPKQWTRVVYRKRHISRAWGPAPDATLRHSAKVEFTIASSVGGKGSVCFDSLMFEPRVPDNGSPLSATATSTEGSDAVFAVDANTATAWRGNFADAAMPALVLDLGRVREFGGLALRWSDAFTSDYAIALSNDAHHWRDVRRVRGGNGGRDWIALPDSEARYLRLVLSGGPGTRYALAEATIEPLAFAATPNDFIKSVAQDAPRGWYPRGFIGEQSYWTIVGINGGDEQGLISEDGAIESGKGRFSIEPFVVSNGKIATWADVTASQSLQDDYLPIPSVRWTHPDFELAITSFAQGTRTRSQMIARYVLTNTSTQPRDYTLALALRPLQVNPPSQFLNTAGGISAIHALAMDRNGAIVDGRPRVRLIGAADSAFATSFDAGMAVEHLMDAKPSLPSRADDATGMASGAWRYAMHLAPGESREVGLVMPLTGDFPQAKVDASAAQERVAAQWRETLGQLDLRVPAQGKHLVDTLRTATAQMLISRKGQRLRPGTRSYARAWIRDGAMISEALLRTGHEDVAAEFLRWYAPYQFDNGKVPCCVDDRGSDPVPENDSQGELIHTVAEVYRYTHDRQLLQDMWPHVVGAVNYMDTLRLSERTEANRATNLAFYGMMPASISHEGYSAKPMHSYWDDFWALRGYDDAVRIAQWLGHDDDAKRYATARDQFRDDLHVSIAAATRQRGIDFIPGSAELGDFDATSTTIALSPGSEQDRLPRALLDNTFERYWRDFVARRDGARAWKDYTPYELRTIGAFVRLGWRDRAHEALDFFFADQQPRGWNQWAEVVSHTPRKPFFLGDLPHAWVASDYVRSVLDMFAYARDSDDALVIAAGLPADWLSGEGVSVAGLRTPYGSLKYTFRSDRRHVYLRILSGVTLPPGGIVVQLPAAMTGGKARVDGALVSWRGAELRIDHVPADVMIDMR